MDPLQRVAPRVIPDGGPVAASQAQVAATVEPLRARLSPPAEVPDHIRRALDGLEHERSWVLASVRVVAGLVLAAALAAGIGAVTGVGPSPLTLLGL